MMTVMVAALFVLGTAYAAATIYCTLRHYSGAVSMLRGMLAECQNEREVRIVVREWTVSGTARVLRPDFTRPKTTPLGDHGLRAAA